MIRILMSLTLILSSTLLSADPISESAYSLTPCFNMKEVERMGRQISELLKEEFCNKGVNPKTFAAVSQHILPKIMTESFLGVTPPENWQQLTDDLINNCLKGHNICKKEARKDFEACIKPRVPLILVQYGPWFAEHCPQLNKSLVHQWSTKKEILKKTIKANRNEP